MLTYKDCVGVNDDTLRGLSMLLTGLAATWWQGVKDSTPTWQDAKEALKQTFGPRLPPHKIYRCVVKREQRADESTDLFVCHLRALFSQLPSSLSETVQLDMCYDLLHRRIREKVPRTSFDDFGDLLTQARRAEDILEDSRTCTESKPAVTYSTVAKPSSPAASSSNSHKVRSYCNYCRQYGHVKDDCPRLVNRVAAVPTYSATFLNRAIEVISPSRYIYDISILAQWASAWPSIPPRSVGDISLWGIPPSPTVVTLDEHTSFVIITPLPATPRQPHRVHRPLVATHRGLVNTLNGFING